MFDLLIHQLQLSWDCEDVYGEEITASLYAREHLGMSTEDLFIGLCQ